MRRGRAHVRAEAATKKAATEASTIASLVLILCNGVVAREVRLNVVPREWRVAPASAGAVK